MGAAFKRQKHFIHLCSLLPPTPPAVRQPPGGGDPLRVFLAWGGSPLFAKCIRPAPAAGCFKQLLAATLMIITTIVVIVD